MSLLQAGPSQSPAKLAKIRATADRQQKKEKRRADEGELHKRRQEMDKAKVSSSQFDAGQLPFSYDVDHRRCEKILLSFGPDGFVQAFRGYQGTCNANPLTAPGASNRPTESA